MTLQTLTGGNLVTGGNLKNAARGLILCAVMTASTAAAVSSAGVADATCTPGRASGAGAHCDSDSTSFSVQLDEKSSVSAQGSIGGGGATISRSAAAGAPPSAEDEPAPRNLGTAHSANDPVLVAESMVGTDVFGSYGCEDFVDAAHGLTTETGIAHNAALSFYQSLAARGLDHHETPIPRGALVFSAGSDGNHVDISRGDGTFVSGGVQGLSPGYGDGHQVQILPTANLGPFTMYGWVYPPW